MLLLSLRSSRRPISPCPPLNRARLQRKSSLCNRGNIVAHAKVLLVTPDGSEAVDRVAIVNDQAMFVRDGLPLCQVVARIVSRCIVGGVGVRGIVVVRRVVAGRGIVVVQGVRVQSPPSPHSLCWLVPASTLCKACDLGEVNGFS